MGHKSAVISKEEEGLQALCLGSETTQVEEGAFRTVANVNPHLQVSDGMGKYAGE